MPHAHKKRRNVAVQSLRKLAAVLRYEMERSQESGIAGEEREVMSNVVSQAFKPPKVPTTPVTPHNDSCDSTSHRTTPHLTAPHRTAPHLTAPHRTATATAPHLTAPLLSPPNPPATLLDFSRRAHQIRSISRIIAQTSDVGLPWKG